MNNPNTPKKGKKLTQQEVVTIHAFLAEHIVKNNDDTVSYKGLWTDAAVADRFGVSEASVQNLRRGCFGHLHKTATPAPSTDVVDVKRRLSVVEDALSDLKSRHSALIDNLCLNRVVSVKHLRASTTGDNAPTQFRG